MRAMATGAIGIRQLNPLGNWADSNALDLRLGRRPAGHDVTAGIRVKSALRPRGRSDAKPGTKICGVACGRAAVSPTNHPPGHLFGAGQYHRIVGYLESLGGIRHHGKTPARGMLAVLAGYRWAA